MFKIKSFRKLDQVKSLDDISSDRCILSLYATTITLLLLKSKGQLIVLLFFF